MDSTMGSGVVEPMNACFPELQLDSIRASAMARTVTSGRRGLNPPLLLKYMIPHPVFVLSIIDLHAQQSGDDTSSISYKATIDRFVESNWLSI
jgi:hypothetical protein